MTPLLLSSMGLFTSFVINILIVAQIWEEHNYEMLFQKLSRLLDTVKTCMIKIIININLYTRSSNLWYIFNGIGIRATSYTPSFFSFTERSSRIGPPAWKISRGKCVQLPSFFFFSASQIKFCACLPWVHSYSIHKWIPTWLSASCYQRLRCTAIYFPFEFHHPTTPGFFRLARLEVCTFGSDFGY